MANEKTENPTPPAQATPAASEPTQVGAPLSTPDPTVPDAAAQPPAPDATAAPAEDARADTDRTFIARASAFVDHEGGSVRIKKGITRVREGHGLLQAYPQFFEAAGARVQFDTVETTRDAPAAPPAAAKKTTGRRRRGNG